MEINSAFSRPRLFILGVFALVFTAYITVAYGRLAFSEKQVSLAPSPSPERGAIFDRNGIPLAIEIPLYHLAIRPSEIRDMEKTVEVLSRVTDMDAGDVRRRIEGAGINFLYLKKKMTEEEYDVAFQGIRSARLTGVHFDKIAGRIYPENALASQLVGFLGDDGKGLSGIEYSLDQMLSPRVSPDPRTARNGSSVYLTIDANLQFKLEEIARKAMQDTGGETIMLVAADSATGEVLSYVSLPSANLNEYTGSVPEERVDLPATVAYEPGSVFKIFSVASFLDAGVVHDQDTFFCDGVYELRMPSGEVVTMNCLGKHGWVNARRALEVSCNDALFQMSERLPAEQFITRLKSFGFGSKTGVELPGETNGILKTPADRTWSARSSPTISIGQEVGVSALQVVKATGAFTSGGAPLQLTVLSKIADPGGAVVYEHKMLPLPPVVSPDTAAHLLSYMETGVVSGIGRQAALGDISIGVKTGTAQMVDQATGAYSETDFLADCIAVFPVEAPRIILYIVLTKPRGRLIYASRIVAPVIAEAANTIVDHLGMAREKAPSFLHSGEFMPPGEGDVSIGTVMPNLTGVPKRYLTPLLERPDLRIRIRGEGRVITQTPPPGTPVKENMLIELNLEYTE
ncbi:MAG: transpeptidase family protein [Spirochaetaceae bacterium]|jgi:cell division protein FtsI (penicillin-binding protein 3)|nr:transpeptidase family protein [Spirochaetaceae bacterium]